MIKAKVSTDYKDIERIFAGGTIQKEILKVWSTEANAYVFEAWKVLEMEGPLPLTFNANGEALIDYRIYGNTEQSGTPTPENPIMPIGCGERTENLFDKDNTEGIEVGRFIDKNTGLKVNDQLYYISAPIAVRSEETYCWVFRVTSDGSMLSAPTVGFFDANDNQIGVAYHANQIRSFSFTTPANCAYIKASVFKNDINEAMLVKGSTAPSSYIPYGYKLPILSNSTVTNIYLGEVETTRRIKKLVFDGTEEWAYQMAYTRFELDLQNGMFLGVRLTPIMCTHYIRIADGRSITDVPNNAIYISGSANNPQLSIKTYDYTTTADFKAYLAAQYAAGTPVTVWYVLAEPETGIVNEPLMKIGDYADTVDSTQTAVQIPTYKGTTVIDYDGGEKHLLTSDGYELVDKNQNGFLLSGSALHPEKMYIKYKGR